MPTRYYACMATIQSASPVVLCWRLVIYGACTHTRVCVCVWTLTTSAVLLSPFYTHWNQMTREIKLSKIPSFFIKTEICTWSSEWTWKLGIIMLCFLTIGSNSCKPSVKLMCNYSFFQVDLETSLDCKYFRNCLRVMRDLLRSEILKRRAGTYSTLNLSFTV